MGGGGFRYEDNRFYIDLGITAVDFAAPESTWQNALSAISEMLFAATTGQMQLGRLSFWNDGAIDSTTDILIAGIPGHDAHTPLGSTDEPFVDQITLHQDTFEVPLIALHELGHFLFCLQEEYREVPGGSAPRCTCDPGSGACIMEFGDSHSVRLGNDGLPALNQPEYPVNQFCFENHLDGVEGDIVSVWENGQHFTYQMSCWHKIHEMFDQRGGSAGRMRLPNDLTAAATTHQPVEWTVLESTSRLAVVILGSTSIQDESMIAAIRQTMIARVRWELGKQSQVALWTDASAEPIVAMDRVQHNDLPVMLDRIGGARFGDSVSNAIPLLAIVQAAVQQFRGPARAADSLVLVAPGRLPPLPGAERVASELAERRIRLEVTTLGAGPLAGQWASIAASNRWVNQTSLPQEGDDRGRAFALQEHLLRTHFEAKPGFGLAGWSYGMLPADPRRANPPPGASAWPPINHPAAAVPLPQLPLRYDLHPYGVDQPVYVETGAAAVVFVLAVPPDEAVEFAVVSPGGITHQLGDLAGYLRTVDSAGMKSIEVNASAEFPLAGRWIVRMLRRDAAHQTPFCCGTYVQNRAIYLDANTHVSPNGSVKFRCRTFHREALDHVEVTLQVFRAAGALIESEPIRTAVLSRSVTADPTKRDSQNIVSGSYLSSLELTPGDYLAVLRTSHAGGAVRLLDTGRPAKPDQPLRKVEPVPSFTRLQIKRFSVT